MFPEIGNQSARAVDSSPGTIFIPQKNSQKISISIKNA